MAKNSKDKYIKVIDGTYWARITYLDQYGKRHELKRRAENKTHAKQLVQKLLLEIEQHGTSSLDSANMTFADLAQHYKDKYLIAPQYVDGRKVAGLKSYNRVNFIMLALKDYFGKKKIRTITGGDIEGYKLKRLSTPKTERAIPKDRKPPKEGKARTLTSVNRELALLRRILNIAHREGWLLKNPFLATDKIISAADEKKRERILTREEEKVLLENCIDQRSHLKAIIICAVDTGMRAGELFSLTWKDVDLEKGIITIAALNTKILQSRQIAITTRLAMLLEEQKRVAKQTDKTVFGLTTVKRSFNTLRDQCGLSDLRFHDLRHTAATRLIQQGIPLQEVGRILGHTQANTTYRYVNANTDTARRAAAALNQFHAQSELQQEEEDERGETIN